MRFIRLRINADHGYANILLVRIILSLITIDKRVSAHRGLQTSKNDLHRIVAE